MDLVSTHEAQVVKTVAVDPSGCDQDVLRAPSILLTQARAERTSVATEKAAVHSADH